MDFQRSLSMAWMAYFGLFQKTNLIYFIKKSWTIKVKIFIKNNNYKSNEIIIINKDEVHVMAVATMTGKEINEIYYFQNNI